MLTQTMPGLSATQGSLAKPRNLPVQALDYIAGYLGALGAMVGLARRAEQGGSWLVRVSLVQVAHWLAGLGTVDPSKGLAELRQDSRNILMLELNRAFAALNALHQHIAMCRLVEMKILLFFAQHCEVVFDD